MIQNNRSIIDFNNLRRFLIGKNVKIADLALHVIQITQHKKTLKRHQILIFIAFYMKLTHNAPSHRQIAIGFNLSKTTVRNHLLKLEIEGLIQIVDGHLRLTEGEYTFYLRH